MDDPGGGGVCKRNEVGEAQYLTRELVLPSEIERLYSLKTWFLVKNVLSINLIILINTSVIMLLTVCTVYRKNWHELYQDSGESEYVINICNQFSHSWKICKMHTTH